MKEGRVREAHQPDLEWRPLTGEPRDIERVKRGSEGSCWKSAHGGNSLASYPTACCARRRLTEVNLLVLYSRRTISVFDPMELSLIDVLGTRAMQTDFGGRGYYPSSKPSCSKQVSGSCRKSSHGVRASLIGVGRAIRSCQHKLVGKQVIRKIPRGSFNVCRCREPSAGDSRSRADDQARVPC